MLRANAIKALLVSEDSWSNLLASDLQKIYIILKDNDSPFLVQFLEKQEELAKKENDQGQTFLHWIFQDLSKNYTKGLEHLCEELSSVLSHLLFKKDKELFLPIDHLNMETVSEGFIKKVKEMMLKAPSWKKHIMRCDKLAKEANFEEKKAPQYFSLLKEHEEFFTLLIKQKTFTKELINHSEFIYPLLTPSFTSFISKQIEEIRLNKSDTNPKELLDSCKALHKIATKVVKIQTTLNRINGWIQEIDKLQTKGFDHFKKQFEEAEYANVLADCGICSAKDYKDIGLIINVEGTTIGALSYDYPALSQIGWEVGSDLEKIGYNFIISWAILAKESDEQLIARQKEKVASLEAFGWNEAQAVQFLGQQLAQEDKNDQKQDALIKETRQYLDTLQNFCQGLKKLENAKADELIKNEKQSNYFLMKMFFSLYRTGGLKACQSKTWIGDFLNLIKDKLSEIHPAKKQKVI